MCLFGTWRKEDPKGKTHKVEGRKKSKVYTINVALLLFFSSLFSSMEFVLLHTFCQQNGSLEVI
jgi:uncharacterized membrane protein